jgi:mycofactocin precursor
VPNIRDTGPTAVTKECLMAENTDVLIDEQSATNTAQDDALVVEDVLVEEVSIDGMCGVY